MLILTVSQSCWFDFRKR